MWRRRRMTWSNVIGALVWAIKTAAIEINDILFKYPQ
jgi:hypothetical protein